MTSSPPAVARRLLPAATLAVLTLGGCASAPAGSVDDPRRLVATDDSFTIDVPQEWHELDVGEAVEVLASAQGPDAADQLFVTRHDGVDGGEWAALEIVTQLMTARDPIGCYRVDDTRAFGAPRLVFDCPQEWEGRVVRRVLVPHVRSDGTSLLVFVQTTGEHLVDTAAVVRPILDSVQDYRAPLAPPPELVVVPVPPAGDAGTPTVP
ncbi:hypothetical protein [Cellulomonas cellasea]|uniref:Lipoprotein n=2 Tax=Cellulomonas cellasea TaxID=43670 RepID=A0A0A0B9Q4_9CELL|nr:hypothetical protein [Cellulomonas cellasea]KGM01976.1 hypothetical protein Q760_16180 [Cellulomonas cellasea DSM 20118]GEA90079.1 hypothetical protein CCE01nite_40280 [Cellulomonas cellasea]